MAAEIETVYYNAGTGAELGRSFSHVNQFDGRDGNTITSTNVHYENADREWLGNEYSDSNGNNGHFYYKEYASSFTEATGFDLNGDTNEAGTAATYKDPSDGSTDITIDATNFVRVEVGEDTWTYTDISGNSQTDTPSFTHYYDKDWTHLGGVEVQDGETIKWGANWTFVGVEKDVSSLSTVTDTDSIAYKLFGAAKFDTDSWIGWNGETETETVYYVASGANKGEKLGSAITNRNSFDDNGAFTRTNTSYNDADYNYLGNEYSDGTNSGYSYELKYTTSYDEPSNLSLDGDTTNGESGLTTFRYNDQDVTLGANTPLVSASG